MANKYHIRSNAPKEMKLPERKGLPTGYDILPDEKPKKKKK